MLQGVGQKMEQISQNDLLKLIDCLDVLLEEREQDKRQTNNTTDAA